MDRRVGAVGMALLVGWLVNAAPASAGTYDVHACSTAAGKFTNNSWSISVPGSDFARASCSASDARPEMSIVSGANKTYAAGRVATMTFSAPPGATIANFRWQRQLFQFNPMDGAPGGQPAAVHARAARRPGVRGRRDSYPYTWATRAASASRIR